MRIMREIQDLTKTKKDIDKAIGALKENSKPITVSVCMIVRDEDKNLEELIPQIEWADEIVIIDTGIVLSIWCIGY